MTQKSVLLGEVLAEDKDYTHLPKINGDDIHDLWDLDYYDGPLTSIGLYQGEPCYYECVDMYSGPLPVEDEPYYRRYAIVKLTPDEFNDEQFLYRYFLFCRDGEGDLEKYYLLSSIFKSSRYFNKNIVCWFDI